MSAAVRLCELDPRALQALEVDAYALFVAEDERPLWGLGGLLDWQMRAGLSRRLLAGDLTGASGETVLSTTSHGLVAPRIFAYGLGPQSRVDQASFARRAHEACRSLLRAGVKRVAIGLPEVPALPEAARALSAAADASSGLQVWLVGPTEPLSRALSGA